MNNMLSDKMLRTLLEEFDLQEDEVFKITGFDDPYMINKRGLIVGGIKIWSGSMCLNDLLNGSKKVIKLPFVPELNGTYYVPDISMADLYFKTWNYGTKHDKHRIEHEMCFRTKQGAIAKAKEWLKLINEGN